MYQLKSEYLQLLQQRAFFHQCTDLEALDGLLCQGVPVPAYIGFDCTADCLHVGSLVQIMLLYWLQQCGHQPIVLIGGGTTKIGDPSGKDQSRRLLTADQIAKNKQAIHQLLRHFLKFGDGPTDAILVDNATWLDGINYIDFLRDVGPHFTINRMLTFESVKLRLERHQPLTFLEFNYMLLQAYDFVELSRRYGCVLQLGGSDQWGNIVSGIELGRRLMQKSLYGYTVPLITNASGQKMGKTAEGAVWLSATHLPVYDFWQFWRNTQDQDVVRFLRLFTRLPLDEIDRLSRLKDQETNQAKIVLANAVTGFCHGQDAALLAEQTAEKTFSQGLIGDDLPGIQVTKDDSGLVDVLVRLEFAASKSAARRLIAGGGVRVNGERIVDLDYALVFVQDHAVKVSVGKKRHGVVSLT